jgi:ATP-binding cassette subfamily B protein
MKPREPETGSLRQTPPPTVAARLVAEGISEGTLLLCAPTDIDRLGQYRREWLAVTRERLMVIAEEAPAPVLLAFGLDAAKEFRVRAGVGSGLLQATVDGVAVDILRYSNTGAYRFERIAHKLEKARKGEPIEVNEDDLRDPRRCKICGLLLDQPGESCPNCVNRGRVLSRMLKIMRPYRGRAIGIMCFLLVGIALDLVSPQLTRFLVDHVFEGGAAAGSAASGGEAAASKFHLLLMVVLTLAGVQLMRMVVNIINGRLAGRVGTALTFDMRSRLVQHLQKLSIGYYDKQQVGSLVGRVAYDTEALHGFVWQLTGGFLLQILMVVGVGIMMFSINTRLALFALLPGPLVMGATVFFWRYIYPRYYRVWDASSKQAGALSGMLSGIRVIKAFSQEDREHERFVKSSGRLRVSRNGVDGAITTFNAAVSLVFQLGGWIVWYAGGRDVLVGKLTLGQLMAFFGYLWMFYGPLAALPQFTNWLTSFVTQANRLFEILDTPVSIAEPDEPKRIAPIKGEITLNEVTFGYSRHTPVLKDVSLTIQPGEMVGIVGASGSGKSTIVNLICRFYDVDDGRVLIDGVDVRELAKEELRGQIGVVLQEPFIFRGTILENLAYGRPRATPEDVLAAARAGNCHEFILKHAHAYDTWVGERGAGLSGGERQRLSIARVLLTDPRVLILDEATSSVDAESEAAIQGALAELVKGRTTIAIAHRLSTLRRADRIVVVDQGRIAESGSHEALLEQDGIYARLVRLQSTATDEEGFDLIKKAMSRRVSVDRELVKSVSMESAPVGSGGGGHGRAQNGTPVAPGAVTPGGETDSSEDLPPIGGHRVRWLRPDVAQVHLGSFNTLHVSVRKERSFGGVFAVRCMPVRHPRRYLSLRYLHPDGHEQEIGIIRDLAEWPEDAQRLIDESLRKRYFVQQVRTIEEIKQVGSYLHFRVETDLGPAQFTMRAQGEKAQEFGVGGKMLIDTDENRYLVPEVEALPERDRRMFKRYIYW